MKDHCLSVGISWLGMSIHAESDVGWGSSVGEWDVDDDGVFVAVVGSEMEEVIGSSDNLAVDWVDGEGGGMSTELGVDVGRVVVNEVLHILADFACW